MATLGETFPHDDELARFVVAMGMARNDIEYTALTAGHANTDDAPEFYYLVLVSMGLLFEATHALKQWRQESSTVRAFLGRLPEKAKKDLATATGLAQRVGPGVLKHARNRTFHYPHPMIEHGVNLDAELADVLKTNAREDAAIIVRAAEPRRLHFEFSGKVALGLALNKHSTEDEKLRKQTIATLNGTGAFVRLVDALVSAYFEARDLSV
jgi:hypothetical protein